MNSKSEIYLRNRINKDVNILYEKLITKQPEIQGQPILLIKILQILGIFKKLNEIEVNKSYTTQQESFNEKMQVEAVPKNLLERKEAETVCFQLIWKMLSFGKRKVTKGIIVNLISSLLNLDNSEITDAVEIIMEALQLPSRSLDLVGDIESFINLLSTLSINVNIIQNLTDFIKMFKVPRMSTEEEELGRCTFNPSVNRGFKRLKRVSTSKAKRKNTGLLEDGSRSPRIHEELYSDYIQRDNNLKVLEIKTNYKLNKEYTFRPKITPMSEKYKRNPKEIVTLFNKGSLISYMKIIRNLKKLSIDVI